MNKKNSKKKTLLITGTSTGIGYHLVNYFISKGFFIYGLGRTEPKISNNNYKHFTVDLSDSNSFNESLQFLKKMKIDHFIHNAGIFGQIKKFENCNLNTWKKVFNINLFSGVYILQNIIKSLINNKGCIIFMAGGGSTTSLENWSSYSTSKTAIVRFVENIADEYKKALHVYAVSPGINKTYLINEAVKQGYTYDIKKIVPFSLSCKLCEFLINKKEYFLSGRQIHVKDDYLNWKNKDLKSYNFKLRRITKL